MRELIEGRRIAGIVSCLLAGACLAAVAAAARGAPPAPRPAETEVRYPRDPEKLYSYRREHDPNGIGKFYMGREIAHVMGFAGAAWLDRPERETEERLSLLIESLQLQRGMVVADIGAGSGRITLLLAEAVGPEGRVYAVDIQQKMLDLIAAKLKRRKLGNVTLVRGTAKSPRLPQAAVDLVLLVDVYHEFAYPYEMLYEISRALKPGGRVVFVEYRMEDPRVPIKRVHKMSEAQVRREASWPEFGLRHERTIGVLPRQHIIVFRKVSGVLRSTTPGGPAD
ncbi:MAG: methyltransferase domain-containing protein [Planctomycetota bacterium]|nr:MAG: methyltransferase domain-containing protein [Planctomycetota bacterium]